MYSYTTEFVRNSKKMREGVLIHRPKIHCFGHIHGDGGNTLTNGVCYINASVCDEDYNPLNKIVTIDYEKV